MKRKEQLEALETMKSAERKEKRKHYSIKSYEKKVGDANKDMRVKVLIDSDWGNCNSIKSLSVNKKNTKVEVINRFIKGEILNFLKISLVSFICDAIVVFAFPDDATHDIYSQNKIIKCLPKLLLSDTDSTSFQFVFICELNCVISEYCTRQMLFEIIIGSKIKDQLYLTQKFYALFEVQNKS